MNVDLVKRRVLSLSVRYGAIEMTAIIIIVISGTSGLLADSWLILPTQRFKSRRVFKVPTFVVHVSA